MMKIQDAIQAKLKIERVNYARQCFSLFSLVTSAVTVIAVLSGVLGSLSHSNQKKILLFLEFFGLISSVVSLLSMLLLAKLLETYLRKIRQDSKGLEGFGFIAPDESTKLLENDQEDGKKTFLDRFGTRIGVFSSLASLAVCCSMFVLRLLGESRLCDAGRVAVVAMGVLSFTNAVNRLLSLVVLALSAKGSRGSGEPFLATCIMLAGGCLGLFGSLLSILESNVFKEKIPVFKNGILGGYTGYIVGLLGMLLCTTGVCLALKQSYKTQRELDELDVTIKESNLTAVSQDVSTIVMLNVQGILETNAIDTWAYGYEHGRLEYMGR